MEATVRNPIFSSARRVGVFLSSTFVRIAPTRSRLRALAISDHAAGAMPRPRLSGEVIESSKPTVLETAVDGVEYAVQLANIPPADGTFMTGEEIARYGDTVIARLQRWWDGLGDKSCRQKVKTFFGMQPIHMLFERSTWHSAQHARQLAAVLERFGIEPNGPLTAADLAGLPLPERLWE